MTAVSEKDGAASARRSSVVLPLPRNPVSSVSGSVSKEAAPVTQPSRKLRPRSFHGGPPSGKIPSGGAAIAENGRRGAPRRHRRVEAVWRRTGSRGRVVFGPAGRNRVD